MLRSQTIDAPGVDRSHQVLVHLVFGIFLSLDSLAETQSAVMYMKNMLLRLLQHMIIF